MTGLALMMTWLGGTCFAFGLILYLIGLLPAPGYRTMNEPLGAWCRANRRNLFVMWTVGGAVLVLGSGLTVIAG